MPSRQQSGLTAMSQQPRLPAEPPTRQAPASIQSSLTLRLAPRDHAWRTATPAESKIPRQAPRRLTANRPKTGNSQKTAPHILPQLQERRPASAAQVLGRQAQYPPAAGKSEKPALLSMASPVPAPQPASTSTENRTQIVALLRRSSRSVPNAGTAPPAATHSAHPATTPGGSRSRDHRSCRGTTVAQSPRQQPAG